jgi:hypothetical protein
MEVHFRGVCTTLKTQINDNVVPYNTHQYQRESIISPRLTSTLVEARPSSENNSASSERPSTKGA